MSKYLIRPTKATMAELPEFSGLPLCRIHLVNNTELLHFAATELNACTHLGFDTESKPTFIKGEASTGPHLIQLATTEHAFLFQILPEQGVASATHQLLTQVLQSPNIVKVGFGLSSDRKPLWRNLGIVLNTSFELSSAIKQMGYQQQVGLQAGVALVLAEYLPKSKRQTLSNWAAKPLSEAQLHYAANDAYASLWVYLIMKRWHLSGN
ncbi:3'-5' exonuclease [Oceanisphaera pacifica]|uniref:3'-5' exonuclease domain-containing protein 2 n=1 Tax=Oceanisphaera pacifica TaxID=2818389 RepID=A0ABS3NDQ5_9GAMM|nr:3'-5' exonuclease [Oceanisphaera pacifica]MBO1518723.1 3'-5' exonuclease domain-containing protein 2 [Oceanisphaera pacifica]